MGTLVFIILLIGISTNFIWNISIVVDGSEQLENIENDILEAGIKVGMKKSEVNIQETINKIRFKRNDISWMGIEIKGTNVIVKVVKSAEAPEVIDEKDYSNIIATKSATITKIIAQNGTAKVKNGDKVEEGQILIQGVMEGKYTGNRYVHSLGEVEGIVEYTKSEKIPLKFTEKVKTGNKETKIRIKINNFQINFYKTLSKFKIYDTIEKEKKFKIFSNLYLPISITKITVEELENVQMEYSIEKATEIGTEKLEQKLEQEIGKEKNILNKDINIIKLELFEYEKDEKIRRMKEYIYKIVQDMEEKPEEMTKEVLNEKLSSKMLVGQIINIDKAYVKLYKIEDVQEHSTYKRWEEDLGSDGQVNAIYFMFAVCIISYISMLTRKDGSSKCKKVIIVDNPFGATSAVFLWKVMFEILKENNVQLIAPGHNISKEIISMFEVNYVLKHEFKDGNKKTVVVEQEFRTEDSLKNMNFDTIDGNQQKLF